MHLCANYNSIRRRKSSGSITLGGPWALRRRFSILAWANSGQHERLEGFLIPTDPNRPARSSRCQRLATRTSCGGSGTRNMKRRAVSGFPSRWERMPNRTNNPSPPNPSPAKGEGSYEDGQRPGRIMGSPQRRPRPLRPDRGPRWERIAGAAGVSSAEQKRGKSRVAAESKATINGRTPNKGKPRCGKSKAAINSRTPNKGKAASRQRKAAINSRTPNKGKAALRQRVKRR